jgi:hypothetical protein
MTRNAVAEMESLMPILDRWAVMKFRGDPGILQAWPDIRQDVYIGSLGAITRDDWRGRYGVNSVRKLVWIIVKRKLAGHLRLEDEERTWRVCPFLTYEGKRTAIREAIAGQARDRRDQAQAETGWIRAPREPEPDLETAIKKLLNGIRPDRFERGEKIDVSRVPFGVKLSSSRIDDDAEPVGASNHPLDEYLERTSTRFWGQAGREAVTAFAEDGPGDGRLTRWKLSQAYWMDPLERVTVDELREKILRAISVSQLGEYAVALTVYEQGFMLSEFDCMDASGRWLASYQKRYALDSFRKYFREELGPRLGLIKESSPRSFTSRALGLLYDPTRQNPNHATECLRHKTSQVNYMDPWAAGPDQEGRYERPSLVFKRHVRLLNESRKIQEREAYEYPVCVRCGKRIERDYCRRINGLWYCPGHPPRWAVNYFRKYGPLFVKNLAYGDYTSRGLKLCLPHL